jgi:hypothetical protein
MLQPRYGRSRHLCALRARSLQGLRDCSSICRGRTSDLLIGMRGDHRQAQQLVGDASAKEPPKRASQLSVLLPLRRNVWRRNLGGVALDAGAVFDVAYRRIRSGADHFGLLVWPRSTKIELAADPTSSA